MGETNRLHYTSAADAGSVTLLEAELSDFSYARHAHSELALGVTLSGLQDFSCKGRFYRSRPGQVMLFNPGDAHNGNPGDANPLRYTMLYIDPGAIRPLIGCSTEGASEEFRIRETNFRDDALARRILRLSAALSRQGTDALELEQHLYEIALRLGMRLGRTPLPPGGLREDPGLARAKDLIHDTIGTPVTIDELSRVANMSKYHFIRLFRSRYGITPHRYVITLRVRRALELLRDGVPPTDVAHRLGFFDASHLTRCIRRSFGLTPGQFQTHAASAR